MAGESLAAVAGMAIERATSATDAVRLAVDAIHEFSDRFDWTGVYLMHGSNELVLSSFRGTSTPHTRIGLDKGICGAAAREKETIIVPDVRADSRYLSCHIETKSEIVVPIMKDRTVYGEIDVDSHRRETFGPREREQLEQVARLLADRFAAERAEEPR